MYNILFTCLLMSFISLFSANKEEKLRKNIFLFPRLFIKHKNRKDWFIECAATSVAAGGITFSTKYYLKRNAKMPLKGFIAIMAAGCSSTLVINYLFYCFYGSLQLNESKFFHITIPPCSSVNKLTLNPVRVSIENRENQHEKLSQYKECFNKNIFDQIPANYQSRVPYVYVSNTENLSADEIKKNINKKFSPQRNGKSLRYPIVVLDDQTHFYDSKKMAVKGKGPTQHVYGVSFNDYGIASLSSEENKKFTKNFIDGMTKASIESIKFWMESNSDAKKAGVSLRQSMVGLGIYLYGLSNAEDHEVVAKYYADALVREINTAHKDGYKIYSVYNVLEQDRNEKSQLFNIIQNSFKENFYISLGKNLFDTEGITFDGPENYIRDEESRVVIFQNPSNNSGPIGDGGAVEELFCKNQFENFFNDAPVTSCNIWGAEYLLGIIPPDEAL